MRRDKDNFHLKWVVVKVVDPTKSFPVGVDTTVVLALDKGIDSHP